MYSSSQFVTDRHDQTDGHYEKEDLNLFCGPTSLCEGENTIDVDAEARGESTHLLLMLSKGKYGDDAIDQYHEYHQD